jgi:3-hydroxybutyryl-CoA dehydrogenase
MINEAVFPLQEGLVTAEDIDAGMKLGCNHPIGPLALADLIGLDTLLSAYGFRSLQACKILIFRRM